MLVTEHRKIIRVPQGGKRSASRGGGPRGEGGRVGGRGSRPFMRYGVWAAGIAFSGTKGMKREAFARSCAKG